MAFVNIVALALKIWAKVAADEWAFVPIQFEPFQALINSRRGLLRVTRLIGVLDPQNKGTVVMPRKKPVEKRGPRPVDMQITGWRRSKANTNISGHWSDGVLE